MDREQTYDIAYQYLKKMLFNLEIKPGEAISEEKISQKLNISRTPVREAMKTLEREGVIINEKGRKKVPQFSLDDLQQVFELKVAIEEYAFEYAAKRLNATQRYNLLNIRTSIITFKNSIADRKQLANFPSQDTLDKWDELDRSFHALVFEMANNPKAAYIVDNLNVQWKRWIMGVVAMRERFSINIDEHLEMIDALLAGDSNQAKSLVSNHMKNIYQMVLSIASQYLSNVN